MKPIIDYKNLYLEKYKNLPHYYFTTVLLTIGIIANIVSGILFIFALDSEEWLAIIAIGVLVGGWLIAFGIASLVRFITAIQLSQSVVVADSLLKLSGIASQNSPQSIPQSDADIEKDLPEI